MHKLINKDPAGKESMDPVETPYIPLFKQDERNASRYFPVF